MGKRDEDVVGDIKVLEDIQMENPDDHQVEQVKSKHGFEFGYERYIPVSKKTSNRVVYQDQKCSIKKIYVFFQSDKQNDTTPFYCRKRIITFTAVNSLSKYEKLCQKNEFRI